MMYFIARAILRALFKICFGMKVIGAENCPKYGPLIVASNHASFLDPLIAGSALNRGLNFMAREDLFRNRIFGKVITMVNAFPLRREGIDPSAMKTAIDKLSNGNAVLIFPEGTRSGDGNLGNPRPGIGLLAATSGARILPCYIKGSIDALPRHAVLPKFRKISVYIGKPLKVNKNETGKEYYMQIANDTMAAINALKDASTQTTLQSDIVKM